VAYLSRETVRWLKVWLEYAGIKEGAVFRRLIGKDQVGGPMNAGSIALIFKRVAQWIGMPERLVEKVSGHSTRVGATQDLTPPAATNRSVKRDTSVDAGHRHE
jgi:hypothetical protein